MLKLLAFVSRIGFLIAVVCLGAWVIWKIGRRLYYGPLASHLADRERRIRAKERDAELRTIENALERRRQQLDTDRERLGEDEYNRLMAGLEEMIPSRVEQPSRRAATEVAAVPDRIAEGGERS